MMKNIYKKLPEIAVILLCVLVLAIGISQKEGYHMDELLSFQLSNAEYNPWIVPTQPEGRLAKFIHNEIDDETFGGTVGNLVDTVTDVIKNRGDSKLLSYTADVYEEPVWITAEEFQDYVMVNGEDDFNYLSVYFNVKDDNHPPVHFMLLHTVSSFFKGMVTPAVGCVINLIAVVFIMVLLMKIGKILAEVLGMEQRGRWLGIFAALLYGCSTGALASVLLIRMYCVMTAFCVALFYYHIRKWHEKAFATKNAGLIAVTVLGFLTQYFFLFYCLLLAALTAVLLWCDKRTKELLVYIRSMMIAAVIGLVCFPFAISDVFSSGRGVEALGNLTAGLSGYGSRLASFGKILSGRTFGIWLPVVLLVLILCAGKTICDLKKSSVGCWLMLICPVLGYFLLAARMSPYQVDRYIMPVFPFAMLIGAVALVWLADRVEKKSGEKWIIYIVTGVVLGLQMIALTQYDGTYLYKGYEEQLLVAQEYAEYPCICVYAGLGYYDNLLEFTHYSETLLVTEEELAKREDVASVSGRDSVVVLMKQYADIDEVCRVLSEKYGLVLQEDLYSDSIYQDRILLFGK